MKYFTVNNKIAVKQIERKGAETSIQGGFAVLTQDTDLVESEVVISALIDGEFIRAGSKVLLPADSEAQPWNRNLLSHGDKSFVLVPYASVIAIDNDGE